MQSSDGGHPSESQIEQYSQGTLERPELELFEEHLLICEQCRESLAAADNMVAAFRAASRRMETGEPAPASRWVLRPAWVAGFAVSMLAVIALAPWRALTPAAPISVVLRATRGLPGTEVKAGRSLVLTPDLTDLPASPSYRLEIVDAAGRQAWTGSVGRQGAVQVPKELPPGTWFVRVYSPGGDLLREFGLRVVKP